MANFSLTSILQTEQGKFRYQLSTQNYRTMHDNIVELDNSDVPIEVINLQNPASAVGKGVYVDGAKLIKVYNSGTVPIELVFQLNAWTAGVPDADGSTKYITTMLNPGGYYCFPHMRWIEYSSLTSASEGTAYNTEAESLDMLPGGIGSSDTVDGAVAAADTTLTINTWANWHQGDVIILGSGEADEEIVKIKEEPTSSAVVVERGVHGTSAGAHDSGSTIYQALCDMNGKIVVDNNRTTIAAVAGVDVADPTSTENPHLTDSADLFLSKGFRTGQIVTAGGFGNAENNKSQFIAKAAEGRLDFHMKTANTTAAEGAGPSVDLRVINCLTDQNGRFQGFLRGKNAANDDVSQGISPGSIAIKFAKGGSAAFGLNQFTTSGTSSGLSASTAYKFGLQIDGANADITFTTDATDVTMGGINGVRNKIQAAINTATQSLSYWRGANVTLLNGDLIITSKTNIHKGGYTTPCVDTSLAELANQVESPSGGISNVEIFPAQSGTAGATILGVGVFPSTPKNPFPSYFPDDTIIEINSQKTVPNTTAFLVDNGMGSLTGRVGSGSINYETGKFTLIGCPRDAEMAITYNANAALSGAIEYSDANANGIQRVFARGCNDKVKAKLRTIVLE